MNRKADFFIKRIDSHNESIRIANWNALVRTAATCFSWWFNCQVAQLCMSSLKVTTYNASWHYQTARSNQCRNRTSRNQPGKRPQLQPAAAPSLNRRHSTSSQETAAPPSLRCRSRAVCCASSRGRKTCRRCAGRQTSVCRGTAEATSATSGTECWREIQRCFLDADDWDPCVNEYKTWVQHFIYLLVLNLSLLFSYGLPTLWLFRSLSLSAKN